MATTVTFVSGYEVLPLCGVEWQESIEFDEFVANMGDGYFQRALYGTSLGTRSWNVSFKNLKGGSADLEIILNGTPMTPAYYLWDLFVRTKVSGTPFVIVSPLTGTNHLAMFADRKFSFNKSFTKLFSTGVNFIQVRIPGVSGFG